MIDPYVFIPIGIGVLVMFRWVYAYFLFPKAVERMLENIDIGPFFPHLHRTAQFVRLCGHSHWIMALRDIAMLAMMGFASQGMYVAAVVTFCVTLPPLIYGGEYSVNAAQRLYNDADTINRWIANQGLSNGRLEDPRDSDTR